MNKRYIYLMQNLDSTKEDVRIVEISGETFLLVYEYGSFTILDYWGQSGVCSESIKLADFDAMTEEEQREFVSLNMGL